ncbi:MULTISPECIES: MBL fold metallo-hydrolase [Pedobacter]|uniref:MBL fold metallo-hydrolase n=6 Tax=Pedobacter TaxID=84567 RepID=A0A7G9QH47_9SPHI|nr:MULTISPECIES: MBL fold metallo-hydrolase [Pedobacter]KQR68316.1 MBL fold metallo-hydrolase [Pedobacter sp. Leaf176]MCX2575665.1 MBL fold metallo-hydrolase [Pedobacter sandarakinus]MCZ4224757.1 MBL fold metallo-hydrolase [Pedobacter sp. SJ11]PWS29722.1 MBL fold metallo-hydrolase [Pedobacter paludis]QNN42672.1 MBL fold metallo-hydrolase [Pedobacter roseus]
MIIEQIYTGCLAQGAYYIESNGEAAIIDPLREVSPYMERARKNNAKIKYVLETHFHADFVSGHIDLAKESGAEIVYGPNAKPDFDFYGAKDGEVLRLGGAKIKVLHTPGHTMESTCFLVSDEQGKEIALFSGDTLFIGDVGRPDLAQKPVSELTSEMLAGYLFDSLRNKIMPLSDDIMVYPAHGAGSACGKNMSKETTDLLGNQKKTNYALRAGMSKDEFIKEVTDGLLPPPAYFPENVMMNIHGYDSFNKVIERGMQALNPDAFERVANETGAVILDTRAPEDFIKGFLPNSVNIGIDGNFAPWVGTLIPDIKHPILLITDEGRIEEVLTRLSRVGFDGAVGYLDGGVVAWKKAGQETDEIKSVCVARLAEIGKKAEVNILDVRKTKEYLSEHVEGAVNLPLDYINENLGTVDKTKTYFVHCAGGYRSVIFNSIMRSRGYHNLIDVAGGFKAIQENGCIPTTAFVCPSTLI